MSDDQSVDGATAWTIVLMSASFTVTFGGMGTGPQTPAPPFMKASSAESHVNVVRSGMPIEPSPGPCNVASPVRGVLPMVAVDELRLVDHVHVDAPSTTTDR